MGDTVSFSAIGYRVAVSYRWVIKCRVIVTSYPPPDKPVLLLPTFSNGDGGASTVSFGPGKNLDLVVDVETIIVCRSATGRVTRRIRR